MFREVLQTGPACIGLLCLIQIEKDPTMTLLTVFFAPHVTPDADGNSKGCNANRVLPVASWCNHLKTNKYGFKYNSFIEYKCYVHSTLNVGCLTLKMNIKSQDRI